MSPLDHDRRLLLVHAHPDDESIESGATMAKYAAEGAYVCLVTCTLGEEGEVIPEGLRDLVAEDRLGPHRMTELAAACDALGTSDQRYLGGPGRWRDSGMMGAPSNDDPRCFWRADLEHAAAELVPIIRAVRPQVAVTYDARGYYGHPDHIQAHRVTRLAIERAADPGTGGDRADAAEPWRVAKLYATAMPVSELEEGLTALRAAGRPFAAVDSVSELPFGVPDDAITTTIDATDHLPAKVAAMRAHHTQISVDPPFYALSNDVGQHLSGTEHYTLLAGDLGPLTGPQSREKDLFAGL
jgi:N-acetyl-1-D-myo-inositol-2-amino-2-deoxy-alpha-D-glucopyranoside deacetylase